MANSDSSVPSSCRPFALLIALAVSLTLNVVTLIAFPALHYFHHPKHEFGGPDQARREDHHEGWGGLRLGWKGGPPPTPQEMAQHRLDFLSDKLTLTEAQKTELLPLLLQQTTDLEKQHEQEKAAFKVSLDQDEATVRALLTSDQQKQLDALIAERDAREGGQEPKP